MTVDRLRREMSSNEFEYWGMYYRRKAQRQEHAALRAKGGSRFNG